MQLLDTMLFWQDWNVKQRKALFKGAVLIWGALWVGLFFYLSVMVTEAHKDVRREIRQYNRIAPMVADIIALQNEKGQLASLGPFAAAQQVSRDLGLDSNLASIRPMQLGSGQEGVQVLFESLDLNKFVNLMTGFQNKGGLKVVSFILNHRMDNPKLADLQLVLSR